MPKERVTTVTLEGGTKLRLPLCATCGRAEISAEDTERLWRAGVRLARCRCTPSQKAAATGTSDD